MIDKHNRRCYRVYDPSTRVVRKTAHVTLDEAVYPARTSPISSSDDSDKDSVVPKQEVISDSSEQSVGAGTGDVLDRSIKLNDEASVMGSDPMGDHQQEPPEWLWTKRVNEEIDSLGRSKSGRSMREPKPMVIEEASYAIGDHDHQLAKSAIEYAFTVSRAACGDPSYEEAISPRMPQGGCKPSIRSTRGWWIITPGPR